jgi:hypothetical protein
MFKSIAFNYNKLEIYNQRSASHYRRLISSLFYMPLLQNTYSQIRTKNNEQFWTDSDHDLKIKFAYEPENPIVDKPTELKFTVQRISTGDYVKDLEGCLGN